MYQWNVYNERLVRRGEIFISKDLIKSWNKELAVMNRNKKGRKFLYPDSFMKILGHVRVYFGLPYRQTEGLLRTYASSMPAVPDYTVIHKRVNQLDIKQNLAKPTGKNIVLIIDSTGIKLTNRGDWLERKWQKKRRGFLKLHVGIDAQTKEVLAAKITDEHSHDSKHLKGIVSESAKHGTIVEALMDGAFDSRESFSYLDKHNITPVIRVRRNSVPKSKGCYPRKKAVIEQLTDYRKWASSVSYGRRWIVESVFSAIKRIFGEEVRSKKRQNVIQELMLKISLYNRFVTA